MTEYAELHAYSAFSFLEGASLPEELAARCAELGLPAVALTDRDGVYGAPRMHRAAAKAGVRAHVACELTCENFLSPQGHGDTETAIESSRDRARAPSAFRLPLLVENRAGY
ncbi:MAG: PHP domain-containing protein, partial [Terriglobales bacterium]